MKKYIFEYEKNVMGTIGIEASSEEEATAQAYEQLEVKNVDNGEKNIEVGLLTCTDTEPIDDRI